MLDSNQILDGVEEAKTKMESEEVVGKILLIMGKIEAVPVDQIPTDLLVNQVFTLCKLMDNLSDLKEYAYIRSEALDEEYKSKVRGEYLALKEKEKITDGMARAKAEESCNDTKREALVAEYSARRLKELYENVSRLINYTQTKLRNSDDGRVRHNIDS